MEYEEYVFPSPKAKARKKLMELRLSDLLIEDIVKGRPDGMNLVRILNAITNFPTGLKIKEILFYFEIVDKDAEHTPYELREKLKTMRDSGLVVYKNKKYRPTDKGKGIVKIARELYPNLIKELEEVYGWVRNME